MSDAIKHECGIAMVRLLKPLEFYKEKYGTAFYGINKMYLLMEKQHNRGQDGAGFASLKFNVSPGTRYISRVRSNQPQPIQDIFAQINERLNGMMRTIWSPKRPRLTSLWKSCKNHGCPKWKTTVCLSRPCTKKIWKILKAAFTMKSRKFTSNAFLTTTFCTKSTPKNLKLFSF